MSETAVKKANSPVLEEAFQSVRKAAEAGLRMQQEVLAQWSSMVPGMPTQHSAWLDQMKQFRARWIETVSGIAHKQREAMDKQFTAAVESLDAALAITDSTTTEEMRRKSEQFCRKAIDAVRESAELQLQQFQKAVSSWTDLLAKSST